MTLEELEQEFNDNAPNLMWGLTMEEWRSRYMSETYPPDTYLNNVFDYLYQSMARRGLVSVYDLWRVMGI